MVESGEGICHDIVGSSDMVDGKVENLQARAPPHYFRRCSLVDKNQIPMIGLDNERVAQKEVLQGEDGPIDAVGLLFDSRPSTLGTTESAREEVNWGGSAEGVTLVQDSTHTSLRGIRTEVDGGGIVKVMDKGSVGHSVSQAFKPGSQVRG